MLRDMKTVKSTDRKLTAKTSQKQSSLPPPLTQPIYAREYINPIEYHHPYASMGQYAAFLALRYDANRTRCAYYRQIRLVQEHCQCDPASITETQLRDYFLHLKFSLHWAPKTIRQALAAAHHFYVEMLHLERWSLFGEVRAKDRDWLPAVLTRKQVKMLISRIRLRRYRTPIKLIYCCGLRLSECLSITVHDILGDEQKLMVRNAKGQQDRMVPIPADMVRELRDYWAFHRNPLLLFPSVGLGNSRPKTLAKQMHDAKRPMPQSSVQCVVAAARKELNIAVATPHTLRHSYATHLLESGAHIHTIQKLLGHKRIESTLVYLHLTHQTEQDTLKLVDKLTEGLPR